MDLEPVRICRELELVLGVKIISGETLLFFDEVQVHPRLLIALRYFYEKLPALHVIAAGSLLEFAIEEVGMPVGRVSFLHMYPMSFQEYLTGTGNEQLLAAIGSVSVDSPLSDPVHEKILSVLGEYYAVGGMPEAVKAWKETKDYRACLEVHYDILGGYRQDFEKYAKRAQIK